MTNRSLESPKNKIQDRIILWQTREQQRCYQLTTHHDQLLSMANIRPYGFVRVRLAHRVAFTELITMRIVLFV